MYFRLLRYMPNTVKQEFINIGVVLMDDAGHCLGAQMAAENDLRRVRCLDPAADLEMVRRWQNAVMARADERPEAMAEWLSGLDEHGSHALQWSAMRGHAAWQDPPQPGAALGELYEAFVAAPPRATSLGRGNTGPGVRRDAEDHFRSAGVLHLMQREIGVDRFTYPGDPFRIHLAYRNGGTRYIHMLSLEHSVAQAKVLAFTFEKMRGVGKDHAAPNMTAIVEAEPRPVPTTEFTRTLLERGGIEVLPLAEIQKVVRRMRDELHR